MCTIRDEGSIRQRMEMERPSELMRRLRFEGRWLEMRKIKNAPCILLSLSGLFNYVKHGGRGGAVQVEGKKTVKHKEARLVPTSHPKELSLPP